MGTVRSVLNEYRIHNADVCLRCDATLDDLIDVVEGNRVYTRALFVLNKIDSISMEELDLLDRMPHYVPISAHPSGISTVFWRRLGSIWILSESTPSPRDRSQTTTIRLLCEEIVVP